MRKPYLRYPHLKLERPALTMLKQTLAVRGSEEVDWKH